MERNYEAMLILRPDLSEEKRKDISSALTSKIEQLGGKVLESRLWAKERKFAYPLRSRGAEKKKYERGSYWLTLFSLSPCELQKLKETIKLEENILRAMVLKK